MGYICRIDENANGQILARDYFVYDGLGSCRALVSSDGVVVARYDYDAYGAVREQSGQRSNSFKYVAQIGHLTDEETGLIYMRARYYDPEVGRFVSEDPERNGGNWYWYADGNPINSIDSDGQDTVGILFVVGFLLLAIWGFMGSWRSAKRYWIFGTAVYGEYCVIATSFLALVMARELYGLTLREAIGVFIDASKWLHSAEGAAWGAFIGSAEKLKMVAGGIGGAAAGYIVGYMFAMLVATFMIDQ